MFKEIKLLVYLRGKLFLSNIIDIMMDIILSKYTQCIMGCFGKELFQCLDICLSSH